MKVREAHIYNPPVERAHLLRLFLEHAIEDLEDETVPEQAKADIRGKIEKLWLARASKQSLIDERCHALAVAIERASTDPRTDTWLGDLNERSERAILYFYQDRYDAIPAADEKPGFLGGLFANAIDARRASIRGEADGPVNGTFATLCEAVTGHRLTPANAKKIRQNARKEELARKAGG
jgi:hypothetical protein